MKDKEVIVNLVNVAGCEFLGLYNVCKLKSGSTCAVECENYPNCDYKQLQREIKECNQYKNLAGRYLSDYFEVQNELEKVKKELLDSRNKFKALCLRGQCEAILQDNSCFKQVLEKAKKERNKYKKKYRKNRLQRKKYQQALEKIEEIVKTEIISSLYNYGLREMIEDVLLIINEVKK